ncbi:unnamed protein product [Victoria cruziana]
MYLKGGGLWREEEGATADDESPPVAELSKSLGRQKLYREVTLALRSGLRDACADLSFLRLRALRNLLKFLRSVSESDPAIRLFQQSQSSPDLQVVPVLFEHTLAEPKEVFVPDLDHIYSVEPLQITSPATNGEVALALRVLEGCCILHKDCRNLAHKYGGMKVLLTILSTRGALEQGACLDAIVSLMLESPANQLDFEAGHGIQKVAELIKDTKANENIRLKCGEFLLLLVGHVLPSTSRHSAAKFDDQSGRSKHSLASAEEDLRHLLGEKCASLIWAASQFGSTLDMEQRQTALQIHASRVLNSLELYSEWD